MQSESSVTPEKLLFLLLAVAAFAGITYGFSWFVDLVQRWAAMERQISSLI